MMSTFLRRLLVISVLATGFTVSLPLIAELHLGESYLNLIEEKFNRFARKRVETWQQLIIDNKI